VLEELLKEITIEKNTDYIIKLSSLVYDIDELKINLELLKIVIQKIINKKSSTKKIKEFSELVDLFDVNQFQVNDFDFFTDLIFYADKDIDEINSVINLYNYFNVKDSDSEYELNELITEYLKEELITEADSIYESDVQFEESMNEEGYFEVIDGEVERIIDDKYNELETSLVYFSGFDIDEDVIKNEIDISDIKQRLSSDYTSGKFNDFAFERDDDNFSPRLEKDDIESLFEK
jgi:hypothetical protein